ncbi:hypothetical protein CYB_1703 [Synechococcus sp. JA-2-3B'a(2-13)]|nr:hypothetical protein CYB_1703 [Synechococcus sp. JA-2-3B'a(2-13)]
MKEAQSLLRIGLQVNVHEDNPLDPKFCLQNVQGLRYHVLGSSPQEISSSEVRSSG